jgi:hypothetical protein
MTTDIPIEHQIHVSLDGNRIALPSDMKSFRAICSYLSSLAQRQRRIVASFSVEIEPIYLAAAWPNRRPSCRVAATTARTETLHLGIVQTALRQVEDARQLARSAIIGVQINDGCVTDSWSELREQLEEPLKTLNALPEEFCDSPTAQGSRLRQWQFEQLAAVRSDMDEACRRNDGAAILNALENRVMSWLNNLRDLLSLWRETLLLGFRAAA